MKVGDLIRMRSGKMRLILGEKVDDRGIKMYITLMNGQCYTVPQTILKIYGKVISENTTHI
jgi:hypothetical protein